MYAVEEDHLELVNVLLARGAVIESANEDGDRPIHFAAREGRSEVVSLLLAKGAKISVANKKGKTPLQLAHEKGHMSILAELQSAVNAPEQIVGKEASVSDLLASIQSRRLKKEELDPDLLEHFDFDDYKDGSNTISVEELFDVLSLKTDVFLSHDWGVGHANHNRVAEINSALQAKGLITWFDEEKIEGAVRKKMEEGIFHCKCVVVFITKRYMEKVASDNAGDNCQLEFNYAAHVKTNNKMVPVVMEPEMCNTKKWRGPVALDLITKLYVNFKEPILTPEMVDKLYSSIISIIKKPLKSMMESLLKSLASGSPLPPTAEQHDKSVKSIMDK
mmetsp:Transcript_3545/g.5029  ORF Transcript_3545/g.5029 Transcript_3545/m.5029 type:complete len:333 (-) Transcript_3545:479-1477(-)